jgi:hypothetical protein
MRGELEPMDADNDALVERLKKHEFKCRECWVADREVKPSYVYPALADICAALTVLLAAKGKS